MSIQSKTLHLARFPALLAVTTLLFNNGSLRATPVYGQANIAGTVNVSATSVTFNPTFISTGNGVTETLSFSGLTGGSMASLPNGVHTGSLSEPGMVQFTGGLATPITFDLTYMAPGVGSVAACNNANPGSLCTPQGSPFSLLQLPGKTVVATLQMNGIAYAGSAASGYSTVKSIYTTTSILQGTLPQIYNTLLSGQSIDGISFAASFDTGAAPTPEPNGTLLLALGLLGGGLLASHKSRHRA